MELNLFTGFDLIGDIHGHADRLERLLSTLGYVERAGTYRHPERQVVFLGDFIDRGPRIKRVLEIARSMVDAGSAQAVMGNHEFNAIAFHSLQKGNDFESLRPRNVKNIRQHAATIQQLKDAELEDAVDWFRTLPMWLEILGPNGSRCRAVHACWSDVHMDRISLAIEKHNGLTENFLAESTCKDTDLFDAVEVVLKGMELELPDGHFYFDKEGHRRTAIRTQWFDKPRPGTLFQDYVLQADSIDCPVPIDSTILDAIEEYPRDAPPVFVGHFWLRAPRPERLAINVACLDYSVAKDGYLTAYRWDGENQIDAGKFVWI
jgi:Calcineurin-like phosphoesterase